MEQTRAGKSAIDVLLAQVNRREIDLAAHVLTCITRGSYFDADNIKEMHPRALELAYLHLGDD
ncbi:MULTISPECIES: hypothetical protein [Rhizobium]|jgi:hypothetical protein|uniref:hypothetical protein n=1 Tax=Rhizobium TaxID=379 RepID=UPI00102F73FD|nr:MULTISPECIES: hypothetical protein [Rhizobium]MBY5826315.1 hypothetical protein [Rhizobium leguminosarum]TBA44973.1 hypothetical protein ELH62_22515 [Rhizobium ruizarguesonis]